MEWSRRFDLRQSDKNVSRLKQWLRLASQFGSFTRFDLVKRTETVDELFAALECAA